MERLDFLQSGGEELSLWWRTLVDPDPDQDLAQKRENAGDVVEAGHKCSLPVWLRQVCTRRDAAKVPEQRMGDEHGEEAVNNRSRVGQA